MHHVSCRGYCNLIIVCLHGIKHIRLFLYFIALAVLIIFLKLEYVNQSLSHCRIITLNSISSGITPLTLSKMKKNIFELLLVESTFNCLSTNSRSNSCMNQLESYSAFENCYKLGFLLLYSVLLPKFCMPGYWDLFEEDSWWSTSPPSTSQPEFGFPSKTFELGKKFRPSRHADFRLYQIFLRNL